MDSNGFCVDCAKKREDNKRKREEEQRKKIEEEKQTILAIPQYDITLSSEKRKRQTGFEPPRYSNITPKGVYNNFVVFDTETTGVTPHRDRIIELAAVKVQDGVAVSTFHTYINPERVIPDEAIRINHITDDLVANAPKISEVLDSFEIFVGKDTLVAHNLEFDLKFMYYAGSTIMETKRKYIDTLTQAQKMFKKNEYGVNVRWNGEVANYKLGNLCDFLGIPVANAHSALSDAYATARLFLTLVHIKQS